MDNEARLEAARSRRAEILRTERWIDGNSRGVGNLNVLRVWDGERCLIPAFQIDASGHPAPRLAELIALLPASSSGWPEMLWLCQPHARLAGKAPIEVFIEDPQAVIAAARSSFAPGDTNW